MGVLGMCMDTEVYTCMTLLGKLQADGLVGRRELRGGTPELKSESQAEARDGSPYVPSQRL